jgi:hypothetical protein
MIHGNAMKIEYNAKNHGNALKRISSSYSSTISIPEPAILGKEREALGESVSGRRGI